MKKKFPLKLFYCLIALMLWQGKATAQFSLTGQLRTRTELRHGQGTLSHKEVVPAFFTSQRTRLNFGYSTYRMKFGVSVQDIRVWGQDAASINRTTNDAFDGIMLHEAWSEINLIDTATAIENLSVKIGRQELVYDDARLLGNLDWLQQGRRHDLALLKFMDNGWTAHLGLAYNQNAERKSSLIYNGVPTGYGAGTNGIGSMYRTMQFLYLGRKLYFGNASVLLMKDDFNRTMTIPAATPGGTATTVLDRGVWSRYTAGGNLIGTAAKKIGFTASAFYQGGKYRDGRDLQAYFASLSTSYAIGRKFSIGPGIDYLSGNDVNPTTPGAKDMRFDPLYGTPHKFWGYMDYFYVADPHRGNGLVNYYLKSKYKFKDNLFVTADLHQFNSPNKIFQAGVEQSKNLGAEIDIVVNYNLTKLINIEGGYSTMFAAPSMEVVKGTANSDLNPHWAYIMIGIKPDFLAK